MRILACLSAALLLSGCAVTHTTITGPDGRQAFVMKCSGYMRDRGDCLAEAGKLCPQGYAVVDDSSRMAGIVATQYALIPVNRDYLTISCK